MKGCKIYPENIFGIDSDTSHKMNYLTIRMPTIAATMSGNIIDIGFVDFYWYSIISNEVFFMSGQYV